MGSRNTMSRFVRLLLVLPVITLGITSIIGSGDECVSEGNECSEASECCSGNCEDGACCLGIGDTTEGDSTCCSGESVMFGADRFCCATDGMASETADYCCQGLSYVDGTCYLCPPGCSWTTTPATVGEESRCVCPDENGGEVTVLTCLPCLPCPTANPADIYLVRIYSTEKHQCILLEVWAPDPATIEACAATVTGFAAPEYLIENVTDRPEAQTCSGLW